jgi:deferrochelatase/peroxidase EfeB
MKEQLMPAAVDFTDVQGLVRFGFGKMTGACYLLLKIRNPRAAREWLAQARVTTAVEMSPPPRTAIQIAFTGQGLEALGVPGSVMGGFSAEFLEGLAADENRSRRLGDTGPNAPEHWEWGVHGNLPDAVVMLFAEPERMPDVEQTIRQNPWTEAFEEMRCLDTSDHGGREPFGFIDGISQPVIDWAQSRQPSANADQLAYGNVTCLGEFLLGYPNEYGRYTSRPLLDAGRQIGAELPDAEDQPGKKDLGKNGTYLVIRQLEQDVRGFWRFIAEATQGARGNPYELAEAMVGRRIVDGTPLPALCPGSIPGVGEIGSQAQRQHDMQLNRFTYDSDPEGMECPVGAHVRRGNPRTADIPGHPQGVLSHVAGILGFGGDDARRDLVASVRFHRLLRRGREYGPALSPQEAVQPAPADEATRGLHFVAVNANIERQFEFVQNAWMARTKFAGLTEESDPLLGNRERVNGCPLTNAFTIPRRGQMRSRILGLPPFITVRGGAYFFLPGIRALKFLSNLGS